MTLYASRSRDELACLASQKIELPVWVEAGRLASHGSGDGLLHAGITRTLGAYFKHGRTPRRGVVCLARKPCCQLIGILKNQCKESAGPESQHLDATQLVKNGLYQFPRQTEKGGELVEDVNADVGQRAMRETQLRCCLVQADQLLNVLGTRDRLENPLARIKLVRLDPGLHLSERVRRYASRHPGNFTRCAREKPVSFQVQKWVEETAYPSVFCCKSWFGQHRILL